MATMTGSVRATAVPDHGLILVLGVGFDDFPTVDFTTERVAEVGPDIVYLRSLSPTPRAATVVLEAWGGPASDPAGVAHREAEATFSVGEVYVSAPFAERALSPVLPIGPAGRYRVQVDVTAPGGTERFRVRFWPATGVTT